MVAGQKAAAVREEVEVDRSGGAGEDGRFRREAGRAREELQRVSVGESRQGRDRWREEREDDFAVPGACGGGAEGGVECHCVADE